MSARVVACRAERDYTLWLRFDDGLAGAVHLGNLLDIGAFAMWRDVRLFLKARADPADNAVVWFRRGTGVRLDADILHADLAARYQGYAQKIARDRAFQRFMRAALTPPKRRRRG